VSRATYDAEYADIIRKEGVPFTPDAIGKDLIFGGITIALILGFAFFVGPKGPAGIPNPTLVDASPRPDFYFLSLFAALALLPDWMETIVMFLGPALAFIILIFLPFYANAGEKSAAKRPIAVLVVIFSVLFIVGLAWFGLTSPWSPKMEAWSGATIPPKYLKGRTPLEMHGAIVLQNKQCRNCHALGGVGGRRGPALDNVATHLTPEELTRQVLQGGGNMPAYGKKLTPAETAALVAFLSTLRPSNVPPSHNSAPPENNLPRDVAAIVPHMTR
jgi:ubiquinol-cytochrome c reductase cytochrome b subunit